MSDDGGDDEKAYVGAYVDAAAKEAYVNRYGHGSITAGIRDMFDLGAFGEAVEQRTRLERAREQEREEIAELKRERREIDAKIENKESRIEEYNQRLGNITSNEERYEAKLESIEALLRTGTHITTTHPQVENATKLTERTAEGVVQDLKDRNPDVPDYAFETMPTMDQRDPIHNPKWNGVPEGEVDLPVDERDEEYR